MAETNRSWVIALAALAAGASLTSTGCADAAPELTGAEREGGAGRELSAAEREGGAGRERTASTTAALTGCTADAVLAGAPAERRNIIERGLHWADPASPVHGQTYYSKTKYFEGYRMDCSGFVSMSWELNTSYDSASLAGDGGAGITESISWDELEPGDAIDAPHHHIMLFAGWLDKAANRFCVMEEYSTGQLASLRVHGGPDNAGEGSDYSPVRYKKAGDVPGEPTGPNPPTGGGSDGGGAQGDAGCISETLGHEVTENTCVQSRFDDKWYQCDKGRWVDRWSDDAVCTSESPLGNDQSGGAKSAPPAAKNARCHSDTLARTVNKDTCVQSKYDGDWYQCEGGHWVPRAAGNGQCSGYWPL